MDKIINKPIEAVPTPEQQPEAKLTKYERKKALIEKLRYEFKELYGESQVLIIDVGHYKHEWSQSSQLEYEDIDIVVQVGQGEKVVELRGYLSSQGDFKLVREGGGIMLNKDDVGFALKLIDQEKPKMTLNKLKVLMDYFDEIGLYGSSYMRNMEKVRRSLLEGSTVPLTLAGGNGIRLTYNKTADKLEVSFVEGFSDPTFPLRKRVEAWLQENF